MLDYAQQPAAASFSAVASEVWRESEPSDSNSYICGALAYAAKVYTDPEASGQCPEYHINIEKHCVLLCPGESLLGRSLFLSVTV